MSGLGDKFGDALAAAGNGGHKANAIIRFLAAALITLALLVLFDMRKQSDKIIDKIEWTAGVAAEINNTVTGLSRDVAANTRSIDENWKVNQSQSNKIEALGRDLGRMEGQR